MATVVGTVGQVTGVVQAVDATGATRVLAVGDVVYAGETILTGDDGYVAINLVDGHLFDLGRDGQAELDSDLIAVDADPEASGLTATADEVALSVEAIQAAIAAGVDPTTLAPATAAGPAAGPADNGAEGSGHSFVMIDPLVTDGAVGVPELDTEAFGVGFPDLEFGVGAAGTPFTVAASGPVPVQEPEPESDSVQNGNNGWGNGDQDAPGSSLENNNAENAQGGGVSPASASATGGQSGSGGNNGWGNGDQDAPGSSLENNNAENAQGGGVSPNSGGGSGNQGGSGGNNGIGNASVDIDALIGHSDEMVS